MAEINANIKIPEGLENIKALVGLGNPGPEYAISRHNAGFMLVDSLAERSGIFWQRSGNADWGHLPGEVNLLTKKELTICKPMTFMNNSGEIALALKKNGIKPEETLVVHDELEKSLGTISFKFGGSARGHNGLRSFIERWGHDFWRMRMGIGRPENKDDVAKFVLGAFTPGELDVFGQTVIKTVSIFTP